jgi:AcrR family transcriptional regulator
MAEKKFTRQGTARKKQLMAEAAKLFAHSGYYATRVVDIVKSAGVAKGLFYWYFENKEALFRELVVATRDDLRRAQAKAIEGEPDPLARIIKGIDASIHFMSDNKNLYALLRFAGTQERFASLVDEAQDIHANDTARHIEEAMKQGSIPSGDPLMLGHGVVSVVFHFARLKATGLDMEYSELSSFVSTYCLRGLGADPDRYSIASPTPLTAAENLPK